MTDDANFIILLFFAAVLYTSVGHGGGSAYLSIMAIFGINPDVLRPAVLVCNIVAVSPTVTQFLAQGHFDRRIFIGLIIGSLPFAYLGSLFQLPYPIFRWLIAAALIVAAIKLLSGHRKQERTTSPELKQPHGIVFALIGIPIGLLAGLTGIGGGVYLTPVLLLANFTTAKKAAGISAAFILANSLAGLLGQWKAVLNLPPNVAVWAGVVFVGGLLGSRIGSRYFTGIWLKRILAVVLLVAVSKLIIS